MDIDIIFGGIILFFSLGLIALLLVWSHYAIEKIARKNLRSVRDITKGLKNG